MEVKKRVPIRRRVLLLVLLTMLIALLATGITGFLCIQWVRISSEAALTEQLESNLKSIVEQKAVFADAKLEHYEKYIEFVTDYIEDMYADEDAMISQGRIFDAPKDTKEYALTRGFTTEGINVDDYAEELLFFSNLEKIWKPIATKNENLITTVYLGTKSGLLASYDRWSYLSVPSDGPELVYDYFQSGWYTQGMREDGIFYTDLYIDSQGRGLTITVASPFRNTDGKIVGVNCADFDITGLYNELLSIDLGEGAFSFALDREGTVISPDSADKITEEVTGLSVNELSKLRAEPDGIMDIGNVVYVSIPIERIGWTLCLSVPKSLIREDIQKTDQSILHAYITFAAIVVLIVIFAVYAAYKLSKNITYPMELLRRDIKVISEGDLDYRASVYRNDEIGDITEQMNEMVDRLNKTMKDLVNTQQRADTMSELATRDSLTGIRNKTAFAAYIQELQDRIDKREQVDFGIGVFDCDNLKGINDHYGHEKGDEYLKAASKMISTVFKNSPVFRVGGDEFTVVLLDEDFQNRSDLIDRFYRESDKINSSVEKEWERIHVASGIAVFEPLINETVADTIRRADRIMYANKRGGKELDDARQSLYFMESDDLYWKERYILDNFKNALDQHWIKVYYQPIMRTKTGKVSALEALARWIDPVRGMIMPNEFIYVLSRYHSLHLMDMYMVEEVCREFGERRQEGLPPVPVSINISAKDFDYMDVPAKLKEITEKHGITSKNIIIEITEQDIAEGTEHFKEALKQIHTDGFTLWIDDFGSGYSSLNVLSQYDVDRIKFDMDLVRHLDDHNGANRKILEAMMKVCREVGIQTLAEGVETETQLNFLKEIGCDLVQGFYFYKPEPLEVSIQRFKHRSVNILCETDEERISFLTSNETDDPFKNSNEQKSEI